MHEWEFDLTDEPLINSLRARYNRNPRALFKDESEESALKQQFMVSKNKTWSHQGDCYFPGCKNTSIKASHSLSNKLMIQPISLDGHVLTPQINQFKGEYELKTVGVNKASVFPGFCEDHESAFVFENEGCVSNGKELQMQLFRAICRDLHFLENEKFAVVHNKDELSKRFRADIKKQLVAPLFLKTPIDSIIDGLEGELFGRLNLQRLQRQENIDFVTKSWFNPNADNFGKILAEEYYDELIVCPTPLPVALSASVIFEAAPVNDEGTPDFEWLYYVNIFPNNGKTLIHLATLRRHQQRLERMARAFEEDGKVTTQHIERWMTINCEHWYLNPQYWDGLQPVAQKNMMRALNSTLTGFSIKP